LPIFGKIVSDRKPSFLCQIVRARSHRGLGLSESPNRRGCRIQADLLTDDGTAAKSKANALMPPETFARYSAGRLITVAQTKGPAHTLGLASFSTADAAHTPLCLSITGLPAVRQRLFPHHHGRTLPNLGSCAGGRRPLWLGESHPRADQ